MRLDSRYVPTFLALAFTTALTLWYNVPIGTDIWFHLHIADLWAHLQNGATAQFVLDMNGHPYPPLFHFLLIPTMWLGFYWPKLLQIILYPLAIYTATYTIEQLWGKKASLFTGLLLLGLMPYWDRLIQVQPQALDLILYPLLILYAEQNKPLHFTAIGLLLVYNHGFVGLALSAPLAIRFLLRREYKPLILGLAGTIPFLAWTLPYIATGLGAMGGVNNAQEQAFLTSPIVFTLTYVGFNLYPMLLGVFKHENRKTTILYASASSLLLAPLWPDRAIQYVMLPLAMLGGEGLSHLNKKWLILVVPILVFSLLIPWMLLALNGYDVRI